MVKKEQGQGSIKKHISHITSQHKSSDNPAVALEDGN